MLVRRPETLSRSDEEFLRHLKNYNPTISILHEIVQDVSAIMRDRNVGALSDDERDVQSFLEAENLVFTT